MQRFNRRYQRLGIGNQEAEAITMLTRGGMRELHDGYRAPKSKTRNRNDAMSLRM